MSADPFRGVLVDRSHVEEGRHDWLSYLAIGGSGQPPVLTSTRARWTVVLGRSSLDPVNGAGPIVVPIPRIDSPRARPGRGSCHRVPSNFRAEVITLDELSRPTCRPLVAFAPVATRHSWR